MEQPLGFEEENKPREEFVCKLKRSIYGLHQSGRDWSHDFTTCLQDLGFSRCVSEQSVFRKPNILLGIYVDDILAVGLEEEINKFFADLSKKIVIQDFGPVSNILSIEVRETDGGLLLNQHQYANTVVKKFLRGDPKTATSPLPMNIWSDEYEEKEFNCHKFQSAVGSLLYLSNSTRPDLTFATCVASQKMSRPLVKDWKLVKQTLRYFSGSAQMGLNYRRTGDPLLAYVDADFAEDRSDRKSICGMVVLFAGSVVSWHGRKQKHVANSTQQSEYNAMDEGTRKIMWFREFF